MGWVTEGSPTRKPLPPHAVPLLRVVDRWRLIDDATRMRSSMRGIPTFQLEKGMPAGAVAGFPVGFYGRPLTPLGTAPPRRYTGKVIPLLVLKSGNLGVAPRSPHTAAAQHPRGPPHPSRYRSSTAFVRNGGVSPLGDAWLAASPSYSGPPATACSCTGRVALRTGGADPSGGPSGPVPATGTPQV